VTVRVHLSSTSRILRLRQAAKSLLLLGAHLAMLAGASGVLIWVWAQLDGALYQHVQEARFKEARLREETGGGASAIPEQSAIPEVGVQTSGTSFASRALPSLPKLFAPDPDVIGRLEVPRLGLAVMVREGMDAATLRRAAGHATSTALPGERGNFVVLGHRDSFFRGLRELREGDIVRIRTTRASFNYAVQSIQVVEPESLARLAAPGESSVTLITCFSFNYIGPAPRRFVAQARLMDNVR